MPSLVDQHGSFLRVEEAAQLLRISRTSAYALANRWLDSNGTEGLPALRLGRSIRIPTAAIQRLADPDPTPSPEPLRLVDAG
jgi:excisionase family DNA binding protein